MPQVAFTVCPPSPARRCNAVARTTANVGGAAEPVMNCVVQTAATILELSRMGLAGYGSHP
jgi:hypothetical protein